MSRIPSPPIVPRLFLRLVLPKVLIEHVTGDMNESYARDVATRGVVFARWMYWKEAVSVSTVRLRWESTSLPRRQRSWREPQIRSVLQDIGFALRSFKRNPGFTFVAVLTLAFGIGANTAIFSVVNGVLLRPLEYGDPGRLVALFNTHLEDGSPHTVSGPNYVDWTDLTDAFEHMFAYTAHPVTLALNGVREQVIAGWVTHDVFATLGVRPMLGRGFLRGEDGPGSRRVVVLSDGLWHRRFGGDLDVIGRAVDINGVSTEIVGIAPAGFELPMPDGQELWVTDPEDLVNAGRDSYYLRVVARLTDGVTIEQSHQRMNAQWDGIVQLYPDKTVNIGVTVIDLKTQLIERLQAALFMLQGAVGFVLLLACANVANLLLARGTTRRVEFAVRTALGASRGRLTRQFLTEAAVLTTAATVVGVLVAAVGLDALLAIAPVGLPRIAGVSIDPSVLAFTVGAALVTGLVFGTLPAVHAARLDPGSALREGGRGTKGAGGTVVRSLLVIGETALAVILLVGAGLLTHSFVRLIRVDPGFDPNNVMTAEILLPQEEYQDAGRRAAVHTALFQRLRAVPGVIAAGGIGSAPMETSRMVWELLVDGQPYPEPGAFPSGELRLVTDGYFAAMGVPLLQGRAFEGTVDTRDASRTVVVSRMLAEEFWPGENPVGRQLAIAPDSRDDSPNWRQVVGVVGDVKLRGLDDVETGMFYLPYSQVPQYSITATIRTRMAPRDMAAAVRQAILDVEPLVPLPEIGSMDERVATTLSTRRFYMMLLLVFAGVAVLLASVGLYGVLSYMVSSRTGEIGVRVALGASRSRILGLVVRQGMTIVSIGIAVGVFGGLLMSRVLSGLLFEITPSDPLTFTSIVVFLAGVSLAACLVPAFRAARVEPLVALRQE